MSIIYENHEPSGKVYVSDENGEHNFNSEEEYQAYKEEKYKNYPILCDKCYYHIQKDKKCPMGLEKKAISCSYYTQNPETIIDWIKLYKDKARSYYYYYLSRLNHKFKLFGYEKTFQKSFFYWPTKKHPYFMFVKRLINEYEDACRVYRFGYISEKESYYNKRTFFEKFHTFIMAEHINFEYADCIEDYYVHTFNGIDARDYSFKCHKGEYYHVRHVEKYKYYDIIYKNDTLDEYELHICGQISEAEFNKHFVVKELTEILKEKEGNSSKSS